MWPTLTVSHLQGQPAPPPSARLPFESTTRSKLADALSQWERFKALNFHKLLLPRLGDMKQRTAEENEHNRRNKYFCWANKQWILRSKDTPWWTTKQHISQTTWGLTRKRGWVCASAWMTAMIVVACVKHESRVCRARRHLRGRETYQRVDTSRIRSDGRTRSSEISVFEFFELVIFIGSWLLRPYIEVNLLLTTTRIIPSLRWDGFYRVITKFDDMYAGEYSLRYIYSGWQWLTSEL